jgi:hypothetical protein
MLKQYLQLLDQEIRVVMVQHIFIWCHDTQNNDIQRNETRNVDTQHNYTQHYAEHWHVDCWLCQSSFMLSVTYKLFKLSIKHKPLMLRVIMLKFIMLRVVGSSYIVYL